MAIIIDKIFSATGRVKSYIRIKHLGIATMDSGDVQLGVTVEFYASKKHRELAIMQSLVHPTVLRPENEKIQLPEDWVIDTALLKRTGYTIGDYKSFFSLSNYTQEEISALYDAEIMPIPISELLSTTYYLYKSEQPDFPTVLDIDTIKSWLYSKMAPGEALRAVTDTPGFFDEFAGTYEDDLETKVEIATRYFEILPFLRGKINV